MVVVLLRAGVVYNFPPPPPSQLLYERDGMGIPCHHVLMILPPKRRDDRKRAGGSCLFVTDVAAAREGKTRDSLWYRSGPEMSTGERQRANNTTKL